jgi:shikimate kinase
MGSGKSLIGTLIAKKLKFHHLDSDKLIEKETNQKIKDIFNQLGEAAFRKIEEKLITNISNKDNIVLSLGGGSIISSKVRKFLKINFITVFLDVDIKILAERLNKNSKRPLLADVNIEKKIKELDNIRRKYYSLANITIYNDDKPEKTIKKILQDIF